MVIGYKVYLDNARFLIDEVIDGETEGEKAIQMEGNAYEVLPCWKYTDSTKVSFQNVNSQTQAVLSGIEFNLIDLTDAAYADLTEFKAWLNEFVGKHSAGDSALPKVYRALMSQSASPNQTEGELVVGHEYYILAYHPIDDFTNVGASENATGISFVATDTTPTIWLSGSALVDLTLGTPDILLLDNTIGVTSVNFDSTGIQQIIITAPGKFTENKTYSPQSSVRMTNTNEQSFSVQVIRVSEDVCILSTISDGHEGISGALLNTLIEIFVNP